jgi:glutamyl endopeptidase
VVWRIRNGGTLQGSCSGALIDDDSVLAAGHCAYLHDLRYVDGPTLIESATFAPGRNRNAEPFGSCEVESAWAPPQYLDTQAATFDFSVINLAPDCDAVGTETGTFGLFARTGSMALVKANVQGYPSDMEPLGTTRWYGTQKRDHGKIVRSQKRLVFYPMDTTGGQSGGPVWRQRTAGACVGPCAMAVHAYSTDPVSTGVWGDNNAGVRLSAFRIGQILDIAAQNDGGG